jgi:internalin A
MKLSIPSTFAALLFFVVLVPSLRAGGDRERAIKAIKQAGASLVPAPGPEARTYVGLICGEKPDLAAILKEIHYLEEIQYVTLGKSATDVHLKALVGMPRISRLDLSGSKITDDGMKFVTKHEGIWDLLLEDTTVGDAGLKEITKLKFLRRLYMTNTKVTDKGLIDLRAVKGLTDLFVGPLVTDDGLNEIAKITTIRTLSLPGAEITGKGLKNLAPLKDLLMLGLKSGKLKDEELEMLSAFPDLATVSLSCPQITDKGVIALSKNNLGQVFLRGTQVTDGGIRQLVGMSRLRQLDVRDTKVTAEGCNMFRKLRPNVSFLE